MRKPRQPEMLKRAALAGVCQPSPGNLATTSLNQLGIAKPYRPSLLARTTRCCAPMTLPSPSLKSHHSRASSRRLFLQGPSQHTRSECCSIRRLRQVDSALIASRLGAKLPPGIGLGSDAGGDPNPPPPTPTPTPTPASPTETMPCYPDRTPPDRTPFGVKPPRAAGCRCSASGGSWAGLENGTPPDGVRAAEGRCVRGSRQAAPWWRHVVATCRADSRWPWAQATHEANALWQGAEPSGPERALLLLAQRCPDLGRWIGEREGWRAAFVPNFSSEGHAILPTSITRA